MLHHWLSTEHQAAVRQAEEDKFVQDLARLPQEDLSKLASGETSLEKLAYGCEGTEWLDKFKGTPLFEQALALEQQDIQLEVERVQKDLDRPIQVDDTWKKREQINLQKRLLQLKLLQDSVAPAVPEAPAQGAGAPGMGAANNEEMMSPGPIDSVSQKVAFNWESLKGSLGNGARMVGDAAKVVGNFDTPEMRSAVLQAMARGVASPIASRAVQMGKAEGLGRFGQLLTGSRTDALERAGNLAGKTRGVADSFFFKSPTVADIAGKSQTAIAEEVEREQMKSLLARSGLVGGVGALGVGAAGLMGAQQGNEDPNMVLGKMGEADALGRALARNDFSKVALSMPSSFSGGVSGALKGVGNSLAAANKSTKGMLGSGALLGAGLGGVGGAIAGSDPDASGETHMLRNALLGAAGGGALGAVGGNMRHQGSFGKGLGATLDQVSHATRAGRTGYSVGSFIQGMRDLAGSAGAGIATHAPSIAAGVAGLGGVAGAVGHAMPYVDKGVTAFRDALGKVPGGAEGLRKAVHSAGDRVVAGAKDLGVKGVANKVQEHAAWVQQMLSNSGSGLADGVHNLWTNAQQAATGV